MNGTVRRRRPHGLVRNAMAQYLRVHGGGPATIGDIQLAVEAKLGEKLPKSSVRGGLQDMQMFERVSRGVFRLRR
jgi:hypothetical protein